MPVIILVVCFFLYMLSEGSRNKKYQPIRKFYSSLDHSLDDYDHEQYIKRVMENWEGDKSLWRLPPDLPYIVEFLGEGKYYNSKLNDLAELIAFKMEFDDGYWPNKENPRRVVPGYDPVSEFYQCLRNTRATRGTLAYNYRDFVDRQRELEAAQAKKVVPANRVILPREEGVDLELDKISVRREQHDFAISKLKQDWEGKRTFFSEFTQPPEYLEEFLGSDESILSEYFELVAWYYEAKEGYYPYGCYMEEYRNGVPKEGVDKYWNNEYIELHYGKSNKETEE